MSKRRAYLLGGQAAHELSAAEFVAASGGADARIALLMRGGENARAYIPRYADAWKQRGATQIHVIMQDEDGCFDAEDGLGKLRQATGIYIAGGHTPTYHRLYATEPLRSGIIEAYESGIPFAGMSAGALLAPRICAIPPEDTGEPAPVILEGLGVVEDLIVGVHFSEWNALPHVLEAMATTRTRTGLGIDEGACAVFENGKLARVLGESVHEVQMEDFLPRRFTVRRIAL